MSNKTETNTKIITSRPGHFMSVSKQVLPVFIYITLFLLVLGLYLATQLSPSDYEQGENYRIIYIHVPSAWMCIMLYVALTCLSGLYLVTKHPLSHLIAQSVCLIGLVFTLLTLVTGSLWGLPVWGTLWVWDARLTSVLFLFFLYLAYYILSIKSKSPKAPSTLAILGFVNIPIIKYSVDWWNTLHQPASITQLGTSIHMTMLTPIVILTVGFILFTLTVIILHLRMQIIAIRSKNILKSS